MEENKRGKRYWLERWRWGGYCDYYLRHIMICRYSCGDQRRHIVYWERLKTFYGDISHFSISCGYYMVPLLVSTVKRTSVLAVVYGVIVLLYLHVLQAVVNICVVFLCSDNKFYSLLYNKERS